MPRAAIITIGTELLLGKVIDTNGAYLGEALSSAGFDVTARVSVGDHRGEISRWIQNLLKEADLIVTTGGLGPTEDDLTRQEVASAFGVPLVFEESLMREIKAIFDSRGFHMTENNRRQAYLPKGAQAISNPIGTAPAFYVHTGDNREVVCLPGVPRELKFLIDQKILPHLRDAFGLGGHVKRTRVLKICGLGESGVDQQIGDLVKLEGDTVVGLLASPGMVRVLITAEGKDVSEVTRKIETTEGKIRQRLGKLIFGVDDQTLEGVVLETLSRRGGALSIEDEATGGECLRRLLKPFSGKYRAEGRLFLDPDLLKTDSPEGERESLTIRLRITPLPELDKDLRGFEISIRGKGRERKTNIRLGGSKEDIETRLGIIALDQLRKWLDDKMS